MNKHNQYKTLNNSIRELIIKQYDSGKSSRQISDDLDVPCTTVRSVISKFKNSGVFENEKKKCGRKKRLNNDIENLIKNEISHDCSITLNKLKNIIAQQTGQTISETSVHRAIANFEYSFKRVQLIPERRNIENNINIRFEYAREVIAYDQERLIFIDEFGVNCSMRKRYGRAPLGETPRKNVSTIRSKNFSVAAAMSCNELLCFKIKESAYNGESFIEYIQELITILSRKNLKNMIIICDNVPFHKASAVSDVCIQNNHKLKFLPPYTPQLNPIEEVFSAWKEHIRSKNSETKEELFENVNSASTCITYSICRNVYRNMHKFLIKAIAREEF